jgi:hypothetical protein
MKSADELRPDWGNHYYEVTEPFEVMLKVGTCPSNHYYGSSQICGHVWVRVVAIPGYQVHALCGGTFLVDDKGGDGLYATTELLDKSPFEKNYGGRSYPTWPLDKLRKIEKPAGERKYVTEVPHLGIVPAGAKPYGRTIDWVIS